MSEGSYSENRGRRKIEGRMVRASCLWDGTQTLNKIPDPLAIQAHHGAIFKGSRAFEYALEHAKLVDHKLKALAEIKTSSLVGLSLVNGYRLCRRQKISASLKNSSAIYPRTKLLLYFSPLDKLVIEYAERMTTTPVTVGDELFRALRQHLNRSAARRAHGNHPPGKILAPVNHAF